MFTVTSVGVGTAGGLPGPGRLQFDPRPVPFVSSTGRVVTSGESVDIETDGTFSVDLEWKDGLQYRVKFTGDGHWPSFWITCGAGAGEVADDSSTDIRLLTPVDVPSPLDPNYIKGDTGPAGPNAPQPGGLMARAAQGLFTVTQPSASGMTTGFYALAMDPNVAGRVWGNGRDFSTFGYYEPATNTYVAKTLHPGTGAMHELQFTIASGGGATSYAWLMTGSNASRDGQIWRSPLPDANGNGLSWTKMLDLSAMPGGLVSGANSCFRPQCFAIVQSGSTWRVHVVEYSIAPIVGGTSYYYSPDAGVTWTKPKTWANAKHAHSVYVINGAPVVMLGDSGSADLGLWRASSADGSAWSPRISKSLSQGGNDLYGIGAVAGTLNGNPVLFFEYDGDENYGPLVFPGGASTAQIWSLRPTYRLPARHFGTMRSLTLTPAGDLMYVVTTENGAFGTHDDTVWISKADEHTAPVLCGSLGPPSSRPYGRAVVEPSTGYVWFGEKRCHVEEFAS